MARLPGIQKNGIAHMGRAVFFAFWVSFILFVFFIF